jgi:membrane protease YdiL (CAAX protease family)
MGLVLGWARLRTGKVYYGMLLHMSWNAFVLLQEMSR